ncbi:MAG TPA: ferrochelatase [Candidatus Binatia bacterium]|nr:ferrochelatase [Candidatus Binatia bacterium]
MSSAPGKISGMNARYQAVLLIAFGGPACPEEIRPFLARVTQGSPIPPERLEEVALHYEAVGGKSPLNEITFRQAEALKRVLHEQRLPFPVYVGMRNANPFFIEALKQMADDGIQRALGFILSSHQSEAGWDRYQKNVADARAQLGFAAPQVDYCAGWHDHPLFIQTWTELVQASFAEIPARDRPTAHLIFTAHSLPVAMASGSPYVEQFETTARLIAARLGQERWSLAYQSRSGKPTDSWLEPDIGDTIRKLALDNCQDIVVAPIGFVCDHVEVLYDLDIEARKIAKDCGVTMWRAGCPNDHPLFIHMMANVIEQKLKAVEDRG